MALRRKEKALSLDEIKEKAIASTKESWIHGEPLVAFTSMIDQGKLIPLVPRVEKDILAIFFLDAADYATDRALEKLAFWLDRYRKLPWTPILVFRANYAFLSNIRFFDRFRSMPSFLAQAIFIDHKNEWFDFFGITESTLVFSKDGNTLLKAPYEKNFSEQMFDAELKFQDILRSEDPGLPLLEVEKTSLIRPIDHESKVPSEITQSGRWLAAGEAIATEDAHAMLSFSFDGTHLRLTAVTQSKARENAKIQVFLDDHPLPPALYGAQVHPGDRGQSVLEVNKYSGVYEVIRADQKIKGTISFKFLNTLENPLIFYGLRIV